MLCGIREIDNQKVLASQSEKQHGPFLCPQCRQQLTLRKGHIKLHHFAHKPPVTCSHGEGETEEHRKCKFGIYTSLSKNPHVTDLELEKSFGSVIADVYCRINDEPVAIEVQRSKLSVNDITQRTKEYAKLGIYVLWVGLYNTRIEKAFVDKKLSPNAWEKWCHAAYFGRVYYWYQDDWLIPVHFAEHKLYVKYSEWYDYSGSLQSAGGFERATKRFRTPIAANMISIAMFFRSKSRSAWQSGTISIPDCRLYGDILPNWW